MRSQECGAGTADASALPESERGFVRRRAQPRASEQSDRFAPLGGRAPVSFDGRRRERIARADKSPRRPLASTSGPRESVSRDHHQGRGSPRVRPRCPRRSRLPSDFVHWPNPRIRAGRFFSIPPSSFGKPSHRFDDPTRRASVPRRGARKATALPVRPRRRVALPKTASSPPNTLPAGRRCSLPAKARDRRPYGASARRHRWDRRRTEVVPRRPPRSPQARRERDGIAAPRTTARESPRAAAELAIVHRARGRSSDPARADR